VNAQKRRQQRQQRQSRRLQQHRVDARRPARRHPVPPGSKATPGLPCYNCGVPRCVNCNDHLVLLRGEWLHRTPLMQELNRPLEGR